MVGSDAGFMRREAGKPIAATLVTSMQTCQLRNCFWRPLLKSEALICKPLNIVDVILSYTLAEGM